MSAMERGSAPRPAAHGFPVRRALGWALVISLCVAAGTATVAVLSGSFDDTDARVVATSVGFAVLSATAAAGAALRIRSAGSESAIGVVTIALSVASFVLLLIALWVGDDEEGLWRACGTAAVLTLGASHTSVVLRRRGASDAKLVARLVGLSIALGAVLSAMGALPLSGAVDLPFADSYAKVVAVLVIALLLTTALPPVLRRLVVGRERPRPSDPFGSEAGRPALRSPAERLVDEVTAAADRIEELTDAPAVRAECARLRELARSSR
jgi:FtsH-binding integral membrane protein